MILLAGTLSTNAQNVTYSNRVSSQAIGLYQNDWGGMGLLFTELTREILTAS